MESAGGIGKCRRSIASSVARSSSMRWPFSLARFSGYFELGAAGKLTASARAVVQIRRQRIRDDTYRGYRHHIDVTSGDDVNVNSARRAYIPPHRWVVVMLRSAVLRPK